MSLLQERCSLAVLCSAAYHKKKRILHCRATADKDMTWSYLDEREGNDETRPVNNTVQQLKSTNIYLWICQRLSANRVRDARRAERPGLQKYHAYFFCYFFWCVWLFKHISAQSLGASCIKQSPELNVCLLRDGSVILLGGFKGVSLQAGWVRVLGRSGTQTHTLKCARATHAHTHTGPY